MSSAAAHPAAHPAPPWAAAAPKAEANAPKFFAALQKRLAENPGLKNEVRANVTFTIPDANASQSFDLGGDSKATFTIADSDLPALSGGNFKSLYQHGKLKVDGDVTVAHRLGFLKGVL